MLYIYEGHNCFCTTGFAQKCVSTEACSNSRRRGGRGRKLLAWREGGRGQEEELRANPRPAWRHFSVSVFGARIVSCSHAKLHVYGGIP